MNHPLCGLIDPGNTRRPADTSETSDSGNTGNPAEPSDTGDYGDICNTGCPAETRETSDNGNTGSPVELRDTGDPSETGEVQLCTGCARVLPLSEFRLRHRARGIRMKECRPCRNKRDRHRKQRKRDHTTGWKLQKGASAIARETSPQKAIALLNLMVAGLGGPEEFARGWLNEVERLRSSKRLSSRLCRFYEATVTLTRHLDQHNQSIAENASVEDLEAILSTELRRLVQREPSLVLDAAKELGCRIEWPQTYMQT